MEWKTPGWLPYGSDEDSVVLQLPLTQDFTAAEANGTSLLYYGTGVDDGGVGAGRATFHPENGMLFYNDTGTITYRIVGLARRAEMDSGGQISFEVSTAWLCSDESDSEGWTVPATFETLLTVSQGGNEFIISRSTILVAMMIGQGFCQNNIWDSAYTGVSQRVHSVNKGEFTRVNIAYGGGLVGGQVIMCIDGLNTLMAPNGRNNANYSDKWNSIWLGSEANTVHTNAQFTGQAYLRNLQVSSRPPVFPVHPVLAKCVYEGDSQVQTMQTNAPHMDCNGGFSIMRPLQQIGIYPGAFKTTSSGGFQMAQGASTSAHDTVAALLAENPTTVFARWGTNDSASDTYTAAFEADCKLWIEKIFGLNGQPATTVQKLVMGNVPSRRATLVNATYDAGANIVRVAAINAIYDTLEAWMTTTYPLRAGDFSVAKCYEALGGETIAPITFLGQLGDGLDYPGDIHQGPGGNAKAGVEYASALMRILN